MIATLYFSRAQNSLDYWKVYLKRFTIIPTFFSIVLSLYFGKTAGAQVNEQLDKKIVPLVQDTTYYHPPFQIDEPDYTTSPFTGMTRQHWERAGIHILEGAFHYVDSVEQPMFLPKFPGKSYPAKGNVNATPYRRSAAIFEALARTFNIAAPLISNNADLTINGINLKKYYKYHFLQLLTNPDCDYYIGDEPTQYATQQTCELGNLAMWNLLAPNAFWDTLSSTEKDQVAERIDAWANSLTLIHNWRYFNVMMLTFLDQYGYKIDKKLMNAHLDNLILSYAGDGWYRDTGYDYYTMHVFQVYNRVWLEKYGWKNEPGRAKIIEKHGVEFLKNYPYIFGKEGDVNMYGRSILYRLGASAALPAFHLNGKTNAISPGLSRRIASGALLQFISHPHFFNQGIPSLGFYGSFEPGIQSYSCSASPYWMFGSFMALTFPEDHPFWNTKEEMGHWGNINANEVLNTFQSSSGFLLSNHGATGTSEIRPSKIDKKYQDPNYSKLIYNTAFPWEAPAGDGIESAKITMGLMGLDSIPEVPFSVDLAGYDGDVFYRQAAYFKNRLPTHLDMASIVIPGGEIRIERIRKAWETELYLGHFALPHSNSHMDIKKFEVDGKQGLIISNKEKQLAMTNVMGWNKIETVQRSGIHPEADTSTLIYGKFVDAANKYGPVELLVSVLLHKTDNLPWTEDELQPVHEIKPLKKGLPLHLGGMIILLKNGKEFIVDFGNIDGKSTRH